MDTSDSAAKSSIEVLPQLGEEERRVFLRLQEQVIEERQQGGPCTRWSILRNLVHLSSEQMEKCIGLYEASLGSSTQRPTTNPIDQPQPSIPPGLNLPQDNVAGETNSDCNNGFTSAAMEGDDSKSMTIRSCNMIASEAEGQQVGTSDRGAETSSTHLMSPTATSKQSTSSDISEPGKGPTPWHAPPQVCLPPGSRELPWLPSPSARTSLDDWFRRKIYDLRVNLSIGCSELLNVLQGLPDSELAPPFTKVKMWLGLEESEDISPPLARLIVDFAVVRTMPDSYFGAHTPGTRVAKNGWEKGTGKTTMRRSVGQAQSHGHPSLMRQNPAVPATRNPT